jgi:acetyl esterase/lipase
MKTAPLVGVVAGLFLWCGCVHWPARCDRSVPPPAPAGLLEHFAAVDWKQLVARETQAEPHGAYRIRQIELSLAAAPADTNAAIRLEVFQPNRDRSPVILLLPVSGGDYTIERIFARHFVQRGFAVVIAQRRKIPHETKLEAIDPWLTQTVRDNRSALDWIETRPELDAGRIGLFGISMGGIRGVLLAAVDHRIRAAALGLNGGDVPYILAHSTEPGITRRREEFLRANPMTPEEVQRILREHIVGEPNTLAPYVDCQNLLLVLARYDTVVPFRKGLELREHLGRPETLLLPTGHYTAVLTIPWIEAKSVRFFRKHL